MIRNKDNFHFSQKFCGKEPCLSHRNIPPLQSSAHKKYLSWGYPLKQILRQGLSFCHSLGNTDTVMGADAGKEM